MSYVDQMITDMKDTRRLELEKMSLPELETEIKCITGLAGFAQKIHIILLLDEQRGYFRPGFERGD